MLAPLADSRGRPSPQEYFQFLIASLKKFRSRPAASYAFLFWRGNALKNGMERQGEMLDSDGAEGGVQEEESRAVLALIFFAR